MQPRLHRSKAGVSVTRTIVKIVFLLIVIIFDFFFVEKIDLPSPKKEIIEDVTNKIIKLR